MKRFFYLLLGIIAPLCATQWAKPVPTIDNPRKIIFQVGSGDSRELHGALNIINNVLKAYGPEKTEIVVVAMSDGILLVQKNNKELAERVHALQDVGVEFLACGNTMTTKKIVTEDLIEGVGITPAGVVEIIERQKNGYIYIRP